MGRSKFPAITVFSVGAELQRKHWRFAEAFAKNLSMAEPIDHADFRWIESYEKLAICRNAVRM